MAFMYLSPLTHQLAVLHFDEYELDVLQAYC